MVIKLGYNVLYLIRKHLNAYAAEIEAREPVGVLDKTNWFMQVRKDASVLQGAQNFEESLEGVWRDFAQDKWGDPNVVSSLY